MRRLAYLALILAFFSAPQEPAGAAGKDLLASLLDRVESRRGVATRSAVLIPLVFREGLAVLENEPAAAGAGPNWLPEDESLVSVVYELGSPRFLPAGTLLSGLGRERLLSRSVFMIPGKELVVRARRCDTHESDASEESEGEATFGPIAPHAQRKVDLLVRDREALVTLLRVQRALAGPDAEAKTVRETMAAKAIEGRVKSAQAVFSKIPGAYGGAVAGHVLFIGLRPVEIILFREPRNYARHAPKYLRAAAVSLTLWEEYYGVDPRLAEEIDDRLLIPVVEKIVATHRAARVKRSRPSSKEKGGGDLYRITTASEDPVMKFEGRLLIEGAERHEKQPFHLESYQDGKRVVLPSPLTKPGGRPTDAKPDVSHGAMTREFLQRWAARLSKRLAALRAAGGR